MKLKVLVAAAFSVALPSLALAQGQIDTGRANDASNRVGGNGRNGGPVNSGYYSNSIGGNGLGNMIITGNVTQGREFRGNVGYTDPFAFRGPTAGTLSDNFAKNSVGVPRPGAPDPVPNTSVPFYGVSQTASPPPGFALNATRTGYVPPPPTTGQRGLYDQRLGVVDLNQPIAPVLQPGELIMRGSLNPQQAAQAAGILTGSPLYGVREWNPQDPADRVFLENLLNRQNGNFNRLQMDPRDIQRMRNELERALDPQQQQPTNGAVKSPGALNNGPIGPSYDAPNDPSLQNRPVGDQLQTQPLGANGMNTEQGMRFNVLGNARRTSTQYAELNKRLEQYYADRRKTDADYARDFNAQLKAKKDAEAKAADAKAKALAGNDTTTLPKPPVTPDTTTGPDKARTRKPQPVKIPSLAQGVRGEGLANVMKKAEGLMKEGKFTAALDQYDAAEAVTPNNPMILLGRANAELGAGFYARANDHIRQAFVADRALLMGQYDLTNMLGEDRVTRLVNELKEAANKEKSPLHVFLLAYIAYNTGHERQALGYLDLAEKRAPEQAAFYKLLKDHWALPEDGATPDAPKPDLNK